MSDNIRAVILDWAGTTVDYGCFAPIKGFLDAFASIGVEITNEAARKPMGLPKLEHLREIAAALPTPVSEEQILTAYETFEKTLFANLAQHCDIKDYVVEAVAELREQGVKIGSTTGYTSEMMGIVTEKAAEQGYAPDFCATPDMVPKGRPYPYMLWQNMMQFGISNPREIVKVGDTVVDIAEGINAGCWTVAVIMGSSELGLTYDEADALTEAELSERKTAVRAAFYQTGADYIINDLNELPEVVSEINLKLVQSAERRLLTPGPLTTRRAVKRAMLTDHCTWDDEYRATTTSVINDITRLAANDDYATVLLQGSGTYAVEAIINCLCSKQNKILFLINGEYGRRMATIAKKSRRNCDCMTFEMTKPIDLKKVEKRLKKDKDIDIVMFVHCETTTGILNPLAELARLAKSYGKRVFVDAMSSFGAYEIDMAALKIDALAASSNKCLEGVPGLSFVIAKKPLIERSESTSRSHSLDLYDQYRELYYENGKLRFTSPTNVLLALRQTLDEYEKEGGLTARRARYMENHRVLTEGFAALGLQPIIAPEHQSYIITTFELGDLDFTELYNALKAKGFTIYPGKLTTLPSFRIGSIGDVYPSDMAELVKVFGECVKQSPMPHE